MPVPTYDQFIEPLLRYLAQNPSGVRAGEAHMAAADALGVDEASKELLVPSGTQLLYKNRVGWAHDRLKRAGLSSSPKRGWWQITPEGIQFLATHGAKLDAETVSEIATSNTDVRLGPSPGLPENEQPDEEPILPESAPTASQSPDERLEAALAELRQSTAAELLEAIGGLSPVFFEKLVLDLLHTMGYGATRSDLQHVGRSSDGGIDGIISLDRLGLEKVYIQAKRWQNQVGRPEVQGFYGALAGQRARKGVFITTSGFTPQAVEFVRSVEGIVLVDGKRMADLLIEHGVGVDHRIVKIPKLDSDYYTDD